MFLSFCSVEGQANIFFKARSCWDARCQGLSHPVLSYSSTVLLTRELFLAFFKASRTVLSILKKARTLNCATGWLHCRIWSVSCFFRKPQHLQENSWKMCLKFQLFLSTSEFFIAPFYKVLSSCDFRKGKIKAQTYDQFQQHYSFLLSWFISLRELIILQLIENSFMIS